MGETPGDTRARIELGDVYIADGRTAAAVNALAPVFLDDAGLRARLAARFLAAGKPEETIAKFRALPARGPETRLVDYCLGEFSAHRGSNEEARADFERAAAAEPPEASPYVRLAMLDADRPLEKSMAVLRRGLDRLPGDPSLLAARAILEMLRRQFDAALRTCDELDRAIRNGGEAVAPPPALQIHRALALQYHGETAPAVEALVTLMEADPLSLEVFVDRAFEFDRRLDTRAATRETLKRLAGRRPGDPLVPMFTGLYEQSCEEFPAAVAAFQEAEKRGRLRPEDAKLLTPRFWFWYGSALERSGRMGEAEPMILKCIQAEPDFPEPYNYLAYTWSEKGLQLDRAAKFIGIALAHEPENGAYLDTRGWVEYQQGRYAPALADLERAVEKTGEDATVLDHLGDTLLKLGRLKDALPRWSRSLVLDPKNAQVQTKLLQHGVDLAPLLKEGRELQEKKLLDLGPLLGIGGVGSGEEGGEGEESGDEEPGASGDEMTPDDPMLSPGSGTPQP